LFEAKFGLQNMPYQLYPNQRMDMLNNDGMDVQVFVYDKDAPPLKG